MSTFDSSRYKVKGGRGRPVKVGERRWLATGARQKRRVRGEEREMKAIMARGQRDLRLEAPSITSPQPFTSTSTPFFWLRSCKFPLRGYITSSLGLKITNGLSSIFSGTSASEREDIERGRRADNNSRSRASVLGYFDRSSVGANFHYLLHISQREGHTCIGFTKSVITVNG
jgi:hypothetical protein